jgi:hypothetical protein
VSAASAQAPALLTPAAMRHDIGVLRAAWTAIHPGLYRYVSPAALDARFDRLLRWAASERTLGAFYIELARISAAIRCGHSFPNPVNQGRLVRDALLTAPDRLPLAFRWIDGRMIVTHGDALARGGEIVAIDGVPVRTILAALLPLARADGSNDAKRLALMELRTTGRQALFDVYRNILFPPRQPGRVALTDGRGRTATVATVTDAERLRLLSGLEPAEPWTFTLGADRVGVLTMPSWALFDGKWDWRAFIDASVDQLIDGKARGLIVDLRGNEGGLDCGNALLERLIAADLPLPAYRRRVRYRRAPEALLPYLDTWDDSFKDWGAQASGPADDGWFDLAAEKGAATLQPRGRRFGGQVAILAEASNSSATFQFLQAVKGTGIATIVGGVSGGNRRGLNGGAFFFLRLPMTHLEVDLPIIGFFPDRPQADAGIEPDLPIADAPEDIRTGRDRPMERALELLG